jgi:hypothetical protein
MSQFEHVANIVIPLTNVTEIVRDLRSKGLEIGDDFDFKVVAVAEYDDFNTPLYDHIRFSFKEGKWTTYVILKYG